MFEASMQLSLHLLELRSLEDLYTCNYDPATLLFKQASPHEVISWSRDPGEKALCLFHVNKALQRLKPSH